MPLITTSPYKIVPFQFQSVSQTNKLVASDAQADDYFGYSVSIDGTTALVGAYGEDTGGTSAGSAYIFEKNGGSWDQVQKIQGDAIFDGWYFGSFVSIDGDFCAVSAHNGNEVYIFNRTGGSPAWEQNQKLVGSDTSGSDYFGRSVSIKGNRCIVGASGKNAAYIFEYSEGTWTETQKIVGSDTVGGDAFGFAAAIDGDICIVGAQSKDGFTGAAYIFEYSGSPGSWTQVQKIVGSGVTAGETFGFNISMSGTTCAIGCRYDNSNMGSVYIFDRTGGSPLWTETQILEASDKETNDYFGIGVDIDGDACLVGAPGEDTGGSSAGAAYIFTRSGGTWSELQKIQASDKDIDDNFGRFVSISGNTCLVGAFLENPSGISDAGSAYIFDI